MAALPDPLRWVLKALRRWYRNHVDHFYFPLWLAFHCACHHKKAVILCRIGVLGDLICTLPTGNELRKRHPDKLIVLITSADYKKMARLSRAADFVYGEHSWHFSVSHHFFGLIEKIYNPQTTDERFPDTGAQCHLIDDLANSCGITLSNRQPRLFPSPELIKKTQAANGLAETAAAKDRLIIGINCGRTWPVRMWHAAKWQKLVGLIHAEYDVVILQFGFTKDDGTDDFDNLTGVQSVTNRLKSDELVALVASCHLLVSIDSGPVHLAGAVGTPVVGLFGAVDPHYRLPPDSPAVGLFSDVPCLFCHHKTPIGHWQNGCPNDIRCMKELDVQTVFQAVKAMIAKQEKTKPFGVKD
jgi:ADP-heptose:LPS heptosyltransferase